ncbi:DUF1206 domain-containing protein [Kallotenue papyrolyticum]|uniref:DUF1206 domain-containing protein n=1 Tax=Kallotenue papyrolyticum TaxID=1325125 RepID=UPI0004785DC4|nr:DUF1206 domain-containing protein [Kallotenue papyrolyticum]
MRRQQAERAARQAASWIEWLGRLGYAAKGLVYGLVGLLALQVALGRGGALTDPRSALPVLLQAPFGRALLAVVALGLAGHALWRFVQALLDTEARGRRLKGLLIRAGYAGVGVLYLGLALAAVRLSAGAGGTSGTDVPDLTARLMRQPLGRYLVLAVGLVVVGVGLYQIAKGWRRRFRRELRLAQMSAREQRLAERSGLVGLLAHGLALGLVGLFLIVAAWRADPGEARGLGATLATLAQQPFGPWLLGAMALGLLAYACFTIVEARYRRMIVA